MSWPVMVYGHGGFQLVMGVPQELDGLFSGKPIYKWMIWVVDVEPHSSDTQVSIVMGVPPVLIHL